MAKIKNKTKQRSELLRRTMRNQHFQEHEVKNVRCRRGALDLKVWCIGH